MKQDINLYQSLKFEGDNRLSFLHMMLAMGGFLLIISVITVWYLISHYKAQSEFSELRHKQLGWEQKIKQVRQMMPSDHQKTIISQKVRELEKKRAFNKLLVKTLSNLQLRESLRFSKYFEALSKHSQGNTALTQFLIGKGGNTITLRGKVLKAEFVPKFLKRLGQDAMFKEKIFETFKVQASEEGPEIEFTIESDL